MKIAIGNAVSTVKKLAKKATYNEFKIGIGKGGAKNKKGCQMKIKYSFLSVAFVHLTPHHNQIIKSPLRSEVKIIYAFNPSMICQILKCC